jgi:hypothetical protein
MTKAIIGEHVWAGLTEAQKILAVQSGQATLKQITESLLGGPEELRAACREYLAQTKSSAADISVKPDALKKFSDGPSTKLKARVRRKRSSKQKQKVVRVRKPKPRFGLPEGFIPRFQKYERSVLLEDNVYRLPDGQEFIPKQPTGTLGKDRHLYALLTADQFTEGRRGSVYVRIDGRIFNYGVDHADPERELFDTGYTINNLERTGRYAPKVETKRKQRGDLTRKMAQAG